MAKNKSFSVLLFLVPLGVLSYFTIREVMTAGRLGFPLDDAWIFWVFAKNLATGHGLSYNPGQPVLGTTSVLWVLVLSSSYLVTSKVVFISKLWGVAIFLVTVLITYRICLLHTQQKKVALIGTMTFAVAPPMIFGALSGMEISLATLLFCLTLFFHLKERGRARRVFIAPILGGLCFAARPELITLYPVLLVCDVFRPVKSQIGKGDGSDWISAARRLATFGFVIVLWFAFNYWSSGSLLPNTLAAKALDSGLLWSLKNGNVSEVFISLTLNPLIWGSSMLALLVSLNVFWSFFWCRGLVSSLLSRETFAYPIVFLVIPLFRGVVAPVGNAYTGESRYVSFLFPLLAVFFVIGWNELAQKSKEKKKSPALNGVLLGLLAVGAIAALVFYLHPLVSKEEILRFLAGYFSPSMVDFASFKFILAFLLVFVAAVNLVGRRTPIGLGDVSRRILGFLFIAGIILQLGFLFNRAQVFALSVKNINQMQVQIGKWINGNVPPSSLVAINDAGAIKFFGERECLDLEGLVLPEIVPYKILGKDSYVMYLLENRPDYFAVFPIWYPLVYNYLGLENNLLYQVKLKDNIACGADWMTVNKPQWKNLEDAFKASGLSGIEAYLPRKSFRRRWYDAQKRQGLRPDWGVYAKKAKDAWMKGDYRRAEQLFRKAQSCHPQNDQFYREMALFYHSRGDQARAEKALHKSEEYQFFPFPDYGPVIDR